MTLLFIKFELRNSYRNDLPVGFFPIHMEICLFTYWYMMMGEQLDGFSSYLEFICRWTELKYSLCDIHEIHLLGMDRDRSKSDFFFSSTFFKTPAEVDLRSNCFWAVALAVPSGISGCRG